MPHLGEIAAIYENPLTEKSDISVSHRGKTYDLKKITSKLHEIIESNRMSLGLIDIKPLALSDNDANRLKVAIKTDENWMDAYKELINVTNPEVTFNNNLVDALNIPWWNSNNLLLEKDNYDKNSLNLDTEISHSYITQLMRKGLIKDNRYTTSVAGIIRTPEKIMIGKRGGRSFPGAMMAIPAGYVEYGEQLFGAFWRELKEEMRLIEDDLASASIIGRAASYGQNNMPENNTLYVFVAETPLSAEEIKAIWNKSSDKLEHSELIEVENDPSKILDYLEKNAYDPNTSGTHLNKVLASGVASLLTYCCYENPSIIPHAKQLFEGQYNFKL